MRFFDYTRIIVMSDPRRNPRRKAPSDSEHAQMRGFLQLTLFLLLFTGNVSAQRDKAPPRPQLPAAADTNDAGVYYNHGLELLERSPEKAADAFYWAAQLNPAFPDAFYARRVALLMAKPHILIGYWQGQRRVLRDREVMRADSLYLHALTLNPFFSRKLDGVFFDAIIRQIASKAAGPTGARANEITYQIERYLMTAPPATRAWRAQLDGRFESALDFYAAAIKSERRKAGLRVERGRLLFQLDRADSALTELELAVQEMRKADDKDLVFVYQSKALLEHSLGLVYNRLGRRDEAREAFARALQEDLAYGPAHVQLGFLALESNDTTTAISEFDLAVQIAGNDPVLRYQYGYTLQEVGRSVEAEEQLRKSIELNPVYAAPHFTLARAVAAQGRPEEARAALQTFLDLASRLDTRRAEADALLARLEGGQ